MALKKRRRDVTKPEAVEMPKYKKKCDVCGKTAKQTTIWSYVGRKSGRLRGSCKRHLKKVN